MGNIIDGIEKGSRSFLWISIGAACALAPITYVRLHSAEDEAKSEELRSAAKKEEAEAAKKSERSHRLTLGSMGPFMTALATSHAEGNLWFTNVSARVGVMCVYGEATNPKTQQSTSSLTACTPVDAYASTVHLSVMFAGGSLTDICGGSAPCQLVFHDAAGASD